MSDRAQPTHAGLASTFRKFLLVGGVGFFVDTALLSILTGFARWTPPANGGTTAEAIWIDLNVFEIRDFANGPTAPVEFGCDAPKVT